MLVLGGGGVLATKELVRVRLESICPVHSWKARPTVGRCQENFAGETRPMCVLCVMSRVAGSPYAGVAPCARNLEGFLKRNSFYVESPSNMPGIK